jgi:uncharacterized protein YkwD
VSALAGGGAAAAASHGRRTAHASAYGCASTAAMPSARNAALVDTTTLCLMNEIRAANGLRPLRRNGALASIATGQAHDMVRGDYFGDQSLSGQTPLARIMASSYVVPSPGRMLTAQNIGWGTGSNATPAGIVAAWMASPPHRAIILTAAYRDVGVGVAPSVPAQFGSGWAGGTYAVEFGARSR